MSVVIAQHASVAEQRPMVSAVIPTRNRPDLVCRAVRSALVQTYTNVEVVVVVDGPDEATVAALKTVGDFRIRIVALEQNVGGSEARNIGVREAKGDYVALLDDDDEWLPTKLEKQIQLILLLSSKAAVVVCRHLQRTPGRSDIVLPRRAPGASEDISEYMFLSKRFDLPLYGPQTSAYLASKAMFRAIPFKKGQPCHQDWDWFLRVMSEPGVRFRMVDEPLCIFHVTPSLSGVTKRTNWRSSLAWIVSVKHMISKAALASFVVNQVMYRCDDDTDRIKVFRMLCAHVGPGLSVTLRLVALKWFIFSPKKRAYVKRTLSACYALMKS